MSPDRAALPGISGHGVGSLALVGVVLIATLVAAGPAVAADGDSTGAGATASDGSPLAQTDVAADAISLRVRLGPDGSAAWQVAYRVELSGENATAAFEDLRADVEADPEPYRLRFEERMTRTLRGAENATGRDMAIDNVSVRATRESLPQSEYGVVVYRLDWHGFAAVDGEQLRAGDAIDQLFLGGRESLTIAWPDRYDLASVEPDATAVDDGSVTWQGRRDFGPGEPRLVLAPASTGGGASGGDDGSAAGRPLWLVGGAVALLLVLAVAGGWAYYRHSRETDGDGAGVETTAGGEATADDGPPPELLSNEERVLGLVDEHGGRVKQKQVADQLDWTAAKTSQVVGDLREAGELEAFRLGRENVLTLPDVPIESSDREGADAGDGGEGEGPGADRTG